NYIGDESVNPSSRPAASAAPVDDDADLILRRPSATSPNTSKSSPRRAAPKPPRRKLEPVKKETAMPSNVIDFAPILADHDRREKLARLFDVVANSFSKSEPKAASRVG